MSSSTRNNGAHTSVWLKYLHIYRDGWCNLLERKMKLLIISSLSYCNHSQMRCNIGVWLVKVAEDKTSVLIYPKTP